MKRSVCLTFVACAVASTMVAQSEPVVIATIVDEQRIPGQVVDRPMGQVSLRWFRPCPPRSPGYLADDLTFDEDTYESCEVAENMLRQRLTPPVHTPRPDPFSRTLANVRERGQVNCGISARASSFAQRDQNGEWQGFDVSVCRAVAAAVLGDASAVEFFPTTNQARFTALESAEIDLLASGPASTFFRGNEFGLEIAGAGLYDGQGFLVPEELGVTSAMELDGARVCIQTNTIAELNVADFFSANGMGYELVPVEDQSDAELTYLSGGCDVISFNQTDLVNLRAQFPDPSAHIVLAEVVSPSLIGPVVRQNDEGWAELVRWTLNAMIEAEALGISQENVDELAGGSDNPAVNLLLGVEGDLGERLGLKPNWAFNIIAEVGNYREVYDQTFGEASPTGLARGLNAEWSDGGLLYAPPFR